MDIFGAEGKHVKIGKTSITVRDDDGKTCGIIRNAWKFCDLQPNRQIDYSRTVRAAGLWGCTIDGTMNRVIICDGKIIYFNDLRTMDYYKRLAEREDLAGAFAGDIERYNTRLELVEKCKANNVNVINCYID